MQYLSDRSPIVDETGRPQRSFIRYLQELFGGTIKRTVYTADQLAKIAPEAGLTAFCSDANTDTFNAIFVGGGAFVVPVHGDGSAWRVG